MYSLGHWFYYNPWVIGIFLAVMWSYSLWALYRRKDPAKVVMALTTLSCLFVVLAVGHFQNTRNSLIKIVLEAYHVETNVNLKVPDSRCVILFRKVGEKTGKVGFCYKTKYEADASSLEEFLRTLKFRADENFKESVY